MRAKEYWMSSQRFANDYLLVSSEWVAAHGDDANVRLIEVTSPGAGYVLGHIRGAVYLNLNDVFKGMAGGTAHLVGPLDEVAGVLGKLGLAPDKHVIIYDENGGARAAQAFWLLEYLGFPQVSILEGGIERWMAEGRPQTRQHPEISPAHFTPQPRPELYAPVEWVAEHLSADNVQLIDCRTAEEYGEGHIPGAANRNWEDTLTLRAFQTFGEAGALKSDLEDRGASVDKEIVTYCGSGQRSSHTYLALRLLGYPRVRNYIGSWSEWSARADLPREITS
jgi:thiosulfate/3-mercaptopyruvate sulfurtransferase